MSNQGFRFLSREELDLQLSAMLWRWEASSLERTEFVGWAWVVATAADHSAQEDRGAAVAQLRAERDTIHQGLAEMLLSTSLLDPRLVSQRMFLDWLGDRLERASRAAA